MSPDSQPMSDVESHNNAMSLSISEVTTELVASLGATTVAVIGGVKETRAVQQWTSGLREPQRPQVLRFALQLVRMISGFSDREMARAWFHGSNPALDDAVPMVLLRQEPLETIQGRLVAAARSFAARQRKVT